MDRTEYDDLRTAYRHLSKAYDELIDKDSDLADELDELANRIYDIISDADYEADRRERMQYEAAHHDREPMDDLNEEHDTYELAKLIELADK